MPKKSEKIARVRFDQEFGGYFGWVWVTGKRWQRKTICFSTSEGAAESLRRSFGVLAKNIEFGPQAPEHLRPVRAG